MFHMNEFESTFYLYMAFFVLIIFVFIFAYRERKLSPQTYQYSIPWILVMLSCIGVEIYLVYSMHEIAKHFEYTYTIFGYPVN